MMINCPNCGLLQPKDQYCARCGVNMETWKPPKEPLFKKLATNWMVQLALLFVIIFAVVLRDNFTTSKERSDSWDNLPPVSRQIERGEESNYAASSTLDTSPESKQRKKIVATKSASRLEKFSAASAPNTASALEKSAASTLVLMSRSGYEQLSNLGQKLDDGAFTVTRKDYKRLLRSNRREFRTFGRLSRDFELGQAFDIFIGEQDIETGLNIGFFGQITVASGSTPQQISVEVRFWHQLKLVDDLGPVSSYDANISKDSVLVILDPTAHEVEFTNEERTLFESSSSLRSLNEESFIDSSSDIVLVLQFD